MIKSGASLFISLSIYLNGFDIWCRGAQCTVSKTQTVMLVQLNAQIDRVNNETASLRPREVCTAREVTHSISSRCGCPMSYFTSAVTMISYIF